MTQRQTPHEHAGADAAALLGRALKEVGRSGELAALVALDAELQAIAGIVGAERAGLVGRAGSRAAARRSRRRVGGRCAQQVERAFRLHERPIGRAHAARSGQRRVSVLRQRLALGPRLVPAQTVVRPIGRDAAGARQLGPVRRGRGRARPRIWPDELLHRRVRRQPRRAHRRRGGQSLLRLGPSSPLLLLARQPVRILARPRPLKIGLAQPERLRRVTVERERDCGRDRRLGVLVDALDRPRRLAPEETPFARAVRLGRPDRAD